MEPNHPNERLVNINFINCKFANNDSSGFAVSPGKLTSSSIPISIIVKDCEFSNNMRSPNGIAAKAEIFLGQGLHNNPVKGEVRFERIRFNGSKYRIFKGKKAADSFKVIFKDCSAYNVVSTGGGRPVIELEALSQETTTGGYVFDNFRLKWIRSH